MEHCKFTYHRTSFGMNFVIWLAVRGYFVRLLCLLDRPLI